MSDNKKFGRGIAGKGYYIALILCAAAIGITGYVFYRNQNTAEQAVVEQPLDAAVPVATAATEADVPVIATTPNVPQPTQGPTQPSSGRGMQVVAPLEGSTLAEYAMQTLSYNQTTRDWRVHNGMDIAAEEGAPVMAAAEGTVFAADKDETMGYTVAIRHDGGYTTHYSCLQEQLCVQTGDEVQAGQVIGYVGSTGGSTGPHLHFGISYNGQYVNPMNYI